MLITKQLFDTWKPQVRWQQFLHDSHKMDSCCNNIFWEMRGMVMVYACFFSCHNWTISSSRLVENYPQFWRPTKWTCIFSLTRNAWVIHSVVSLLIVIARILLHSQHLIILKTIFSVKISLWRSWFFKLLIKVANQALIIWCISISF